RPTWTPSMPWRWGCWIAHWADRSQSTRLLAEPARREALHQVLELGQCLRLPPGQLLAGQPEQVRAEAGVPHVHHRTFADPGSDSGAPGRQPVDEFSGFVAGFLPDPSARCWVTVGGENGWAAARRRSRPAVRRP